jgi:glycosyltransferase involved in cell wall biosynthesis/spore maturation protein CgeB
MSDGLNIAVLSTDAQTRNQYIICAIADAFRRHDTVHHVDLPTYANLVRYCSDEHVDVLVAIGGAGAIVDPLRRAIRKVGTSVLWTTEDPYELERNIRLANLFDLVFTNDANALPHYPPGTDHLPFAASTVFHDHPVVADPQQFLFDLFFVGTAWPERVDTINALLCKLPATLRKKIGLAGNPHLPNFHAGDLDLITNFRLSPREFARMANRSAVSLTLDRSFSSSGGRKIVGATPPPRLFELALSGTAQVYLTQRSAIQNYYIPGKEIIVAESTSDAAEAIQKIAFDLEMRNRLATSARDRSLRDHLYTHRISKILDSIKKLRRRVAVPHTARRKRILLVSHNVSGIPPFGGVELYQESQVSALKDYEFFVLYPDRGISKLALRNLNTGTSTLYEAGPIAPTSITDTLRERIFGELLYQFGFDLVHYHHLLGHPLTLPLFSFSAGLPSVYQMHDYYGVCHEFNLIGFERQYCKVRDDRVEACDICLSTRGIAPPGAQAKRRWVMGSVFKHIDAFLHNSVYTRQKFLDVFPDLEGSVHHVVGNTARLETLKDLHRVSQGGTDTHGRLSERLQVAILGNFTRPKGGDLLVALFWQTRHDPIDIHIIGRIDPELSSALQIGAFSNLRLCGQYDQSTLPGLLRGMDVSVHFSIWPETYCIGLDEARAAGLVPIVLGYGALAERVRDGVDGRVIDPQHPFDLIKVLRGYCCNRDDLRNMRYDFDKLLTNHDRHFCSISEIYERLISQYPISDPPTPRSMRHFVVGHDLHIRFMADDWTAEKARFDDNPAPNDILTIELERQGCAKSPTKADSLPFVRPVMRPGDECISLLVDEVLNSIDHEMVILLPLSKRAFLLGISQPIGMDRSPIDIVLAGPHIYHAVFDSTVCKGESERLTTVVLDGAQIELGLYSVIIGFLTKDGVIHYGAGARILRGPGTGPISSENPLRSLPWKFVPTWLSPAKEERQSGFDRAKKLTEKLKSNLATLTSGIVAHIDSVCGTPSKRREPARLLHGEHRLLHVRGWAIPRRSESPFDAIIVRLKGTDEDFAAQAPLVQRPDVANRFRKKGLARSGFEWDFPLMGVVPGNYAIEIIGIDSRGNQHSTSAGQIIVEERAS